MTHITARAVSTPTNTIAVLSARANTLVGGITDTQTRYRLMMAMFRTLDVFVADRRLAMLTAIVGECETAIAGQKGR